VEQPIHVHAERLAPVALADVEQFAAAQDAGVVDENVDASEFGGERCDPALDLCLGSDVSDREADRAALSGYRGRGFLGSGGILVEYADLTALGTRRAAMARPMP
jgi:hypothetical protein